MAESVILHGCRGRELEIRFDMNAYAEAERELGRSVGQVLADMDKFGLDVTRVLLWAGTRASYRRMTIQRAGDIIDEFVEDYDDGLERIQKAIFTAIQRSGLWKIAEGAAEESGEELPNLDALDGGSSPSADGSEKSESGSAQSAGRGSKKKSGRRKRS